jgi:hypothetical protein
MAQAMFRRCPWRWLGVVPALSRRCRANRAQLSSQADRVGVTGAGAARVVPVLSQRCPRAVAPAWHCPGVVLAWRGPGVVPAWRCPGVALSRHGSGNVPALSRHPHSVILYTQADRVWGVRSGRRALSPVLSRQRRPGVVPAWSWRGIVPACPGDSRLARRCAGSVPALSRHPRSVIYPG